MVGTIRGAVEPDRYVIIGTHRDAWVYGAADAATGTAAMIEIMTAMSKTMKVSYLHGQIYHTTFLHFCNKLIISLVMYMGYSNSKSSATEISYYSRLKILKLH